MACVRVARRTPKYSRSRTRCPPGWRAGASRTRVVVSQDLPRENGSHPIRCACAALARNRVRVRVPLPCTVCEGGKYANRPLRFSSFRLVAKLFASNVLALNLTKFYSRTNVAGISRRRLDTVRWRAIICPAPALGAKWVQSAGRICLFTIFVIT